MKNKIKLERITLDMVNSFWDMASDPQVAKFIPGFSIEYWFTYDIVYKFSKLDFKRDHAYMIFFENQTAGFISSEYKEQYGGLYTSCFLGKNFRGKGIMYAANKALLDIIKANGFSNIPLVLDINAQNFSSIKLAKSLNAIKIKEYEDNCGEPYFIYHLYA